MDWPLAIDRNRDALRSIVAALFALAGLAGVGSVSTLPRHVHASIMLVLRPAESAVRRLIVFAARGLVLKRQPPRLIQADLPAFSFASALRTPAFSLFDPLKHFDLDDFDNSALPRNSFSSSYDEDILIARPALSRDEPVDAASLILRLKSLRRALDNLHGQARRLVRWQARRDLALRSTGLFKKMRVTPFRPGLPPGWRQRSIHAVDDVLRECHGLALDLLNAPDTS